MNKIIYSGPSNRDAGCHMAAVTLIFIVIILVGWYMMKRNEMAKVSHNPIRTSAYTCVSESIKTDKTKKDTYVCKYRTLMILMKYSSHEK